MYRFEQTTDGNDIVIDGFEAGIADSPYMMDLQTAYGNLQRTGLSDMRNVNVISVPGEASVGYQSLQAQQTPVSGISYTATAANDTFTYTGTVLKNGTSIVITVTTGTVGITSGNTYWVRDATGTTFKVGAGVDGLGNVTAAVDVTTDGTGTFTSVNPTTFSQIISGTAGTYSVLGIQSGTTQLNSTYAVDTNGRAWVFDPTIPNWIYLGNTSLNAAPPKQNGIAVWNNYLLIFRAADAAIDYRRVSVTSSAAAWTYGWKNTTNTFGSRTFIDASGTLYWCNGSGVASLIQIGVFDPTNAGTYTISAAALALPVPFIANCIEQLGGNLLIGGTGNFVAAWDKSSTGYVALLLPELLVSRMVTVNSTTYIFAGDRGRIYLTNGSNIQLYKKIPDHLSGTVEPYYQWGGAIYSKNQLYFSVSAFDGASGAAIPQYGGLWAISTDTDAMRIVNRMSYGTYGGFITEMGELTSTTSTGGVTFFKASVVTSWYDGVSSYGSDYIPSAPTPYSNYEAYIDSDMIPIGNFLNPKTDTNIEFKLAAPMVAGEGVKFAYRQNISQTFTDITSTSRPTGEFTDGLSGVIQVNFQKSQWVQIRTYLKSTSTNPSYTRLREIRLR